MNFNRFLYALLSLLLVGALGWNTNIRLSNPPLSPADKRFETIVKGADLVTLEWAACPVEAVCDVDRSRLPTRLNAAQTQELIKRVRLLDGDANLQDARRFGIEIVFYRQRADLGTFRLYQNATSSALLFQRNPPYQTYKVHPRFEKALREYLDEVAPELREP